MKTFHRVFHCERYYENVERIRELELTEPFDNARISHARDFFWSVEDCNLTSRIANERETPFRSYECCICQSTFDNLTPLVSFHDAKDQREQRCADL